MRIINPISNITQIIYREHGDLQGLTDDDHKQYARVDGTRSLRGTKIGLDADKSASPSAGDSYWATDTKKLYFCYSAGTWTEVDFIVGDKPAAQGDLIFYNGTKWSRLAPGTVGQFLQTGGAGANPSWVDVPAITSLFLPFVYNTESNAATPDIDYPSLPGIVYRFDPSTPEHAWTQFYIPTGMTISAIDLWVINGNTTADVIYSVYLRYGAINETPTLNSLTNQTWSSANNFNRVKISLPSSLWSGTAAGDLVTLKLTREADETGDTLDSDWFVLGFIISF